MGARCRARGFTLTELVVVCAILAILAGVALPVAKYTVQRERETELRLDLRTMRNAIDEYKRYSDAGLIAIDLGTDGYPKELKVLVDGVSLVGQVDKKVKFLRAIPVDPMTGKAEWDVRSYQDSEDSSFSGAENVYDVHSKSQAIGLNGVPYAKW